MRQCRETASLAITPRHRAHRKNHNGKLADLSPHVLMEFITMARKPGGKNNAVTHGAYAEDLILPGESVREFKLLHRGLIEEWKPVGTLEEHTVLTLAQYIWQKRRVDRSYYREASWAQEHPQEEVVDYTLRRKMLDKVQTMQDLTEITDQLPEFYKKWMELEVPRSKFKDEKSWIESLKSGILDTLVQHKLVIVLQVQSREFQAVKAAEVLELTAKKIALDEWLDNGIDKAVRRLAQLKTFKQIVAEQDSRPKIIDQQ
jgi:hypothetical protein